MYRLRTLAALTLFSLLATIAHAHALLEHADPRVGSTVANAPKELSLWFTQKIEPAFSKVEVRDVDGARVDAADVRLDPSDPTLLHVTLRPLARGTYTVHWRVLSRDTHTTEGRFSFSVDK